MKDETQKRTVLTPNSELEGFGFGISYPIDKSLPPKIVLSMLLTKEGHAYEMTLRELIVLYEAMRSTLIEIAQERKQAQAAKSGSN